MFDLQKLIGVKTFSFRNIKDNAECAKAITSCKACTADLSGTHIDYDAADTWAKISSDYQDNGVAITGLGVVRVSPDEAFNRRFFEFAKLANVPLVSITFEIERIWSFYALLLYWVQTAFVGRSYLYPWVNGTRHGSCLDLLRSRSRWTRCWLRSSRLRRLLVAIRAISHAWAHRVAAIGACISSRRCLRENFCLEDSFVEILCCLRCFRNGTISRLVVDCTSEWCVTFLTLGESVGIFPTTVFATHRYLL
jgi:hypothetical protein